MTPPIDDNDPCGTFLRRYRPVPPGPQRDVEAQVIAAAITETVVAQRRRRRRAQYRQWAIPALAASALMAWTGWLNGRSPIQPTTAMSEVETFLTDVWYVSAYGEETDRLALDTSQTDWVLLVYATPY